MNIATTLEQLTAALELARRLVPRKARAWIYGVLLAGFAVAVFYFPQLAPAAPLWLALALALLNLSPADVEQAPPEVELEDAASGEDPTVRKLAALQRRAAGSQS